MLWAGGKLGKSYIFGMFDTKLIQNRWKCSNFSILRGQKLRAVHFYIIFLYFCDSFIWFLICSYQCSFGRPGVGPRTLRVPTQSPTDWAPTQVVSSNGLQSFWHVASLQQSSSHRPSGVVCEMFLCRSVHIRFHVVVMLILWVFIVYIWVMLLHDWHQVQGHKHNTY